MMAGKNEKACGNAASVEIHKKRGFPQAAWKSLAKSARLSHIPTGTTRFIFLNSRLENRTFHLLQKADILTCYGHPKSAILRECAIITPLLLPTD
jgi:hypothetical protein